MWSFPITAVLVAVALGGTATSGTVAAGEMAAGEMAAGGATSRGSSMARVQPAGWRPVFANGFSGSALPSECSTFDGPPGGQTASYYRPDEVRISDGMLRLSVHQRSYSDRPYTVGGIGCFGLSQQYGRYEYRAKVPPGVGLASLVSVWPEQGSAQDATVIKVIGGARGVAHVSNASGTGVIRKTQYGRYDDMFHRYVIEWAPTGLRVLIDGQLVLTDGHVSTARRWLGFAVITGDADTGLPEPAKLPTEFLVDWVHAYAYDPTVTGDPDGPPDGSAAGSAGGGPMSGPRTPGHGAGRYVVVSASAVVPVLAVAGMYVLSRRRRRLRPAHRA